MIALRKNRRGVIPQEPFKFRFKYPGGFIYEEKTTRLYREFVQ